MGNTLARRRRGARALGAALLLAASFVGTARAVAATASASSFDDRLTEFDYLLLGLTVRPEPASQVVPRNTATGLQIELAFSDVNADAEGLLALLPQGIEVAAELVGPGIAVPIPLRGPPTSFLPIPPLVQKGLYLVRDIRLEKDGEIFLRASPDTATVEVIERVLITQVTTRALTLEEIRQKGILFGDDSFTGFNFTLALKLDSRPVTIDLPVIFDSNDVPVPIPPSASIDLRGPSLPINTGIVPVMLKPDLPAGQEDEILPLLPDVNIPGLIVIPGDVGFLNQFFSALLIVSNGAPEGSGLSVSGLEGTISLPLGDDGVEGTSDDPLVVAETQTGGQAFVLPIRGVGGDGELGTNDDTDRFGPSEQGQAEFLLEGRGEGFHEIRFDIQGTLDGLPIGPIPIAGVARGGVVVRNPFFNMTFTAPATVRAGEEFTLFTTITNISNTAANLVSVSLNQAQLSGATLLSGPEGSIETLAPGDSEVLRFELRSTQTGQVSAAYLDFDGTASTGTLRFTLGVGERGIPLSPDTIVLPQSADALPPDVVDAALRVLGQGWSIATAPSGTLPEGVLRVSKQIVLDRATELAEAGFRVQLGEDVTMALESLAFSWASSAEAAFEQILRETEAGKAFFDAVGGAFGVTGTIEAFQREMSLELAALPPHVLVGVDATFIDWTLTDAAARSLSTGGFGTLSNAVHLPTTAGDLALVTRLGSSLYEWTFDAVADGALDVAVSVPRPDGTIGRHVFSGVTLFAGDRGKITLDLLTSPSPLELRLDRDGDGLFEETVLSSLDEVLAVPSPSLVAANVIGPETLTDADPWGRVVALLFDREMRLAEAEDPARYAVDDNTVRSAFRQLSGRIVFLFLDAPVSDLVQRTVTATGLFAATGQGLPQTNRAIGSRLGDPGAIVSGRVLNADGTPVSGAEVLYINSVPKNEIGISQKLTGPDGRYQFDYVRQSPDGPFTIRASDPSTGSVQELSTRVNSHGEHLVMDLVMLGRGGVTGIVTDASGAVVPGARVLVTSVVDPASFALVESNGEGRYVATDIVVGPVAVKAVLGTSSGIASGNLQRAGTFATVDVTINLTAGRVSGGVFEVDGQDVVTPLPGIEVFYTVTGASGAEIVVARSETDENGLFGFQDVPAGDFRVVAIDRVRSRQAVKEGTLTVVGGEAVIENLDVLFFTEDVGTLAVHVQDTEGNAVEGALVTVAARQLATDPTGNVSFENLPAGTYGVSARAASSPRSVSTSATVVAAATTNVALELPGGGELVVTVLDAAGTPLVGQQVIRVQGGPCTGEAAVTDAFGVARFLDVPVGNVTVKALRGSDLAAASTFIQRAGEERPVTLRFAGFGTITGTVFDPNDAPFFGANVVLSAKRLVPSQCQFVTDNAAQQVQTGLDGTFTFRNVPVGSFTASASQPDFFPVPVSVSGVLLADGETRDIDLKLTSTLAGELSGTVFLPDGVTPAGAGVDVTVSGPGPPDVTVRTDAAGLYTFAKIFPAGRYTLTASDPVTGKLVRESRFLQEDQDLDVDLRLLGRAPVEVSVVDGAGEPVSEAFVELASASFPFDRAAGSIGSLDGGRIVFERISEGDFTVTASDRLGRGGRANGMVAEDGVTANVTVSLSLTGTVRGTFSTSDGSEPVPNAQVILRQGSTGRLLGATTTSSNPGEIGSFEFAFVPAGSVLVTATDPLTGRVGEASGTIETEDQVLVLDIRQLGLGTLSGTVTSGGAPVAAARVDLTSSTGLSSSVANLRASGTTGANGGFVFDGVPVGSFTLKATLANLTGTVTGSIDRDGQEVADLEIALQPSGTLVGKIFLADGATLVPGAPVTVKPERGALRSEADSTGSYRQELVPAGDFTVTAEEPGGADAGLAAGTLAEGEELTVDVVFNGTGTVSGTALDSDGATPLSSGKVRLVRAAPFARDETVNVASDGTFQFLRVPVGDYNLSLTANALRGTATGNIPSDGAVDAITIQLADSGNVFGVVVKPDGSGGTVPAANVPVTASGGGFLLSSLTGATGAFRIEGIPLGDFTLRAEDPVTDGLAIVAAAIAVNGEELDLGTLELDLEPIAVAGITPAAGAVDVPPDAAVVVTLTDPVKPASVPGRFQVSSGGVLVGGPTGVSPDGLTVTFTPATSFASSSVVDVLVSKDLKDTFGRSLGTDFTSSFTTGGAVVTGTVFNQTAPVAGAAVTLTAGGSSIDTTTDANGRYRFENVGVGSLSIVATDGSLTGSVVVDVGAGVGVVNADISLAFVASITGQVLEADGATPVASGLEVRVSQQGSGVGLGATDANGIYQIDNVPLGDFTVDVTNPANGDRGRTQGTLDTPNVTVTGVDVQMTGVGSVRVEVTDTLGALVEGVEVSLRFTRFGQTTTLGGTTDAGGQVLFEPVLAGPVSAGAFDPATSREASGTGTVSPNLETLLPLTLEPTGAVQGTVLGPDGASPVSDAIVRVFLESGNLLKGEAATGVDGAFLFTGLPASESPYRIDVFVGTQRRARRRDITVPPDGTATVSVTLVGLGTVTGLLIPPAGESLSSSLVVTLTSLVPDLGGVTDTAPVSDTYTIAGVPVGEFRLSARDKVNGFLGEATGVLNADGETVTVDIDLLDNAFNFSSAQRDLRDGNDARYLVEGDGSLANGTDNVFGASDPRGLLLEITIDNVTTRFTGESVGSREEGGRELVTAPQTIGGLTVRRKVFVPGDGYFARYLEILENTSPDPVSFTAEVVSNVNNGNGAPQVVATASGNAGLDPGAPESWVIVDDSADTDPFESISIPSTAFVLADSSSASPALADFETGVGSSDGRLRARYELSLASGARLVLLHFVSQELTRAAAQAAAERLVALPPEALSGLEAGEIAGVVNFDVPADGTSSVIPLPPLNGRVSGRFLASDGTTPVGTATGALSLTAKLQSSHILYRRIRKGSSSTGSFFIEADPVQGFALPRVDFTLSTTKNYGNLSVSASVPDGSFIGASLVSHAPDAAVTASSEHTTSFTVDRAFDGGTGTSWMPSSSDPEPRPFIELVLPSPVTVNRMEIAPHTRAILDDVRIQLFDDAATLLSDTTEPFSGSEPLAVTLGVGNVERIVLGFAGSTIEVAEIQIAGEAAVDIGSALVDLVFANSASVDATVQSSGGQQVGANIGFKIGSQSLGTTANGTDGRFFQAPTPVTGTDVTVTATATAPNHKFLRASLDVAVVSGQTSTVTVTLPAGALVEGTVRDHTGATLSGRSVALFADTGPGADLNVGFLDTTDAAGRYEFTEVPSGDYRLRVSESGRSIFFPITVAAPATLTQDIQIPIIRDVALTVLLESSGAAPPAGGAFVQRKDSLDAAFRIAGTTNASGQLTILNVAQGSFTVRVTHPTKTSSVTDFVNAITAPGAAQPMTVTIPSFGSVTGSVLFGDGTTAAASAIVEIVGTDVTPDLTTADSTGSYALTGVRAVRPFTVLARHPDAERMHVVSQANGQLSGEGDSLIIDLTLPKTGTVNVTVEQEDGAGISGADVFLLDAFSSDFRFEGQTDANGVVSVTVVPEGSFTARAELAGAFLGEASGVIATHGETVAVTITRPTDATVEGTVFAGDGVSPVEGAPVELRSSDDTTLLASTTADPSGLYRFEGAVAAGTNALVRAFFPGDNAIQSDASVSATEAGQTLVTDLTLPVAVIKGRVLEFDGTTPVTGAVVDLNPAGTNALVAATVRADGSFFVFNEPEGSYELVAEDAFGLVGYASAELLPGELVAERDVLLPELGTVEGFVTDAFGSPLDLAAVALTNANVSQPRTTLPDANGFFRFERVAFGSFSLTYDHPTAEPGIVVPANAAGELSVSSPLASVSLVVPETGNVFGKLRNGAGEVLPPSEDTSLSLEGREHETSAGVYGRTSPVDVFDQSYNQDGVPTGEVSAVGRNFVSGEAGIATGTLSAGGSLELNPEMGTAVLLPREPVPSTPERHEVGTDGAVLGGADGITGLAPRFGLVSLNRKAYPSLTVAAEELGGSQLVLGPVRLAGLRHTRKVQVASGGAYVRTLEIVENPHAVDVEASVFLEGDLFVDALTTSSGDASVDATDVYLGGASADGSAVVYVYAGAAATRLPDATGADVDVYTQEWRRITVPAGGRVILMHFAMQAGDLATAVSRADGLVNLTGASSELSDLTPAERADIVNFEVP